jgi:hypothetical protein
MSIVQTTNFNILLNLFRSAPPPPEEKAGAPEEVILRLLRDGIMPLSALAAKTNLSPAAIVDAVNGLVERRKVEILEQTGGEQKFIRLAL